MSQSEDFAWAIAFAWWSILKMLSFLEYLVFFGAVFFFAENDCKWFVKWILRCFLEFQFLMQSKDFAWAIAFAWWPILKIISFLEYLVFFGAVFCREQLLMICRMDFDMCFVILTFEPKWGFCMGYSLWRMADFENALISRIFGAFWSGFLWRTTVND